MKIWCDVFFWVIKG